METIKKLIVPDCVRKTLKAIIRGKVDPESIIHSDSSRGYDGLVDLEYKKHYRVHHGKNEFVNGKNISMALNHCGPMQKDDHEVSRYSQSSLFSSQRV